MINSIYKLQSLQNLHIQYIQNYRNIYIEYRSNSINP